jgi:rod shape-determining protein MreD
MKIFYKILHFFILIVCLLLQMVFFEYFKSFSLNFDLLLVMVIAVTLFDGLFWGLLYGFLIGLILDLAVGDIVGISALIYSLGAFIASRLVMEEFRYRLLNHLFIVFLITEISILAVAIIRYLFNFSSDLLRIGSEMITAPVCNIVLMFIIFPVIRIGTREGAELGLKYKDKI